MSVLAKHVLTRLGKGYAGMLVTIGALVWLIAMLELLGQSSASGSMGVVIWRSLIQVPVDLIDLLPVVAVLATATVLSSMQAQRELTIMRSAGVSLLRITRLALIPGLGVALAALIALQYLAPVLYQSPERLAGDALSESSLWHPWHGLWVRSENRFMNVGIMEPGQLPGQINIYEFDAAGQLERHIQAAEAVPGESEWLLENVIIKSMDWQGAEDRIERVDEYRWSSFLAERQLELFRQPPASLPLTDLWTYVGSLKQRDRDASEFELVLWQRIALPLACLGMVLIATALSATPTKNRAVSLKVVAAVGIGLGYYLLTNLLGYFGLVVNLPAQPIAILPPVLLTALSIWVLLRSL
ncbi:MAG: LPS export ABC transporter permease LptG [Pseudomonadota bacterium]